jgi:hypothetical protein
VLRIIIVVALAAHGIAHAVALGGLVRQGVGAAPASQVVVRPWLMPDLGPAAAASVAGVFWLAATAGFLLAALSFWGILLPESAWREITVASAISSLAGMAIFAGTWPGSANGLQNVLDLGVAVTMNVAVLVTQLWLHWPDPSNLGR